MLMLALGVVCDGAGGGANAWRGVGAATVGVDEVFGVAVAIDSAGVEGAGGVDGEGGVVEAVAAIAASVGIVFVKTRGLRGVINNGGREDGLVVVAVATAVGVCGAGLVAIAVAVAGGVGVEGGGGAGVGIGGDGDGGIGEGAVDGAGGLLEVEEGEVDIGRRGGRLVTIAVVAGVSVSGVGRVVAAAGLGAGVECAGDVDEVDFVGIDAVAVAGGDRGIRVEGAGNIDNVGSVVENAIAVTAVGRS